jgi:hypothetical protein
VNEPFDDELSLRNAAAVRVPRGFLSQRVFWHSVGILLALAVAWLVFQAYRQPEFLIDFGNMQLC